MESFKYTRGVSGKRKYIFRCGLGFFIFVYGESSRFVGGGISS